MERTVGNASVRVVQVLEMTLGGKKRIEFNNLEELEGRAKQAISKVAFAYYSTGADDNITLAENRKAWGALRLVHRVFVNVDHISMACQVQGEHLKFDLCQGKDANCCNSSPLRALRCLNC